jgi:hypothetical protein
MDISNDMLKERCISMAMEIAVWKKSQIRVFPQLEDHHLRIDPNTNPENEPLFLPSDFSYAQLASLGLTDAASIEIKLHEGEANEAVGALCNSTMVLWEAKNTHSQGVFQNTRALKFIN